METPEQRDDEMQGSKLDLKVGAHEFHAEGREEFVRAQLEEWKQLIAAQGAPAVGGRDQASAKDLADAGVPSVAPMPARPPEPGNLDRILRSDERTVSARFLPQTAERDADVLVLVLYGYKVLKNQHEVPVTQLKAALKQSGCAVDRVDRVAGKYLGQGLLQKGGMGKGGVYRLTNVGEERARQVINEMSS
jgi:hypothetical protein